jgi:hypothetical protein
MNVVYRGVSNPMTISFAGISDTVCICLAYLKLGGKYVMSPQGGNEVVVSVSGKMADGKVANDKKYLELKEFQVQQVLLEEKQELLKALNQI